jgi:predicted NBD/HSP70 family sugar kinase
MKKQSTNSSIENPALRLSKLRVIKQLIEHGSMSRSDMAELLNLSRPALTVLCRELLEVGLVYESPVQPQPNGQGMGRPAILLSLNPHYGYFVGVCITDYPPMLTLCDVNGTVVDSHEIAITREPEATAAAIQQGIQHFLESQQISRKNILGIGIAVSGLMDREQGICVLSNELNWRNVPIARIVHRVTGIPAYVENDANAATMGEKLFGNARSGRNFTVITVDQTIGAANYIEGELYRGYSGGAGEIGHTTSEWNGLPCRCGKKGCLDTIAGSRAIRQAAHEKGLEVKSVAELESLAVSGNAEAIAILYRAGQALGFAAAHLVQNNNPRTVIFALSENVSSSVFIAATQQTIENNILPQFVPVTEILFHRMDRNFWARGAASIAAHEYFLYQASI